MVPALGSSLQGIYIEYEHYPSGVQRSYHSQKFEIMQRCSASILRLAAELHNAWEKPSKEEPYQVQLLFSRLLSELHREMVAAQPSIEGWLEEAVQFIETHYNEDLTREQLAEHANVSPEHFSRAFRKHTGRTFIDYLTMQRIRNAQCCMLTETADMNTLAFKVGYKEGLYLSRKFKAVVGMSPTAFRQKHKRVAALNINHTAILIALGQIPEIGVYTPWTERMKNKTYSQNVAALDPNGHTPSTLYDAIAAARPDVIINYSTASVNTSLLPLAPVIGLPFQTMNWREQFRVIADAINKQQKAEDWLFHYDEQINRINEALDRRLGNRGTAIVWEIIGDRAFGFNGSFGRGAHNLYGDLGFRPPLSLQHQDRFAQGYVETTIEAISSYPADFIFITGIPACPNLRQHLNQLFHSRKWLEMDAVRNKRVYVLQEPDLFCGYDPISTQEQLSVLMQGLLPDHKFA